MITFDTLLDDFMIENNLNNKKCNANLIVKFAKK